MGAGIDTGATIALIGANGMLGRMIQRRAPKGLSLHCYDLPEFDLTDKSQVFRTLAELNPAIIINCAAFTAVDACEQQEELATRVNADGVANLAAVAHDLNATLVHISTDYVFSGTHSRPYREDDSTGPVSAYGRTKLKGEQALLDSGVKQYYIIRTSWLFGPDGPNFVETILRLAGERQELNIVADQIGSPTFTGDLADAVFRLLGIDREKPSQPAAEAGRGEALSQRKGDGAGLLLKPAAPYGIYHFANSGQCSWHEFTLEIVSRYKIRGGQLKIDQINPIATEDYPLPAKRPAYSVFDKEKYCAATGAKIPDWHDALDRYLILREAHSPKL